MFNLSIKKYLILTLIIALSTIQKNSSTIIISIPKTGTFLLEKAFRNITLGHNYTHENSIKLNIDHTLYGISLENLDTATNLADNSFLVSHLNYTKNYEQFLYNKKTTILYNIRDPRDQVVSFAYWKKNRPENYPKFIGQSFDEILIDHIKNIYNWYNLWLPWISYPLALLIRFEDLVGENGGGSYEKQLDTIKKIAQHVKIELTDKRAEEIAETLFGDTTTFREGQIGSWKKHFTQEQKELFKKHGGELLIQLGYEEDLNW